MSLNLSIRGLGLGGGRGSVNNTFLFLIAGQSNAIGRATFDGGAAHPANVFQWNQSGAEAAASNPLDHVDDVAGDMGPDITFAIDFMAANPDAKLVFIPCADGGTSLTTDWAVDGSLYNAAVARANAAIANYGVGLAGILWHQGESDAALSRTTSQYKTDMQNFFLSLREDITNGTNVPVVIGEIGSFLNTGSFPTRDQIIAAQNDIRLLIAYSAVVETGDLTDDGDAIHFDAASLRTMGSRYYTAWSTTAQVQYGAQATGGADLDLSFVEDSAISSTNLIQNWTTNGNTLTFVSVSPALPTGLSINSAGTMTGTPTTATADATYTLTMEDQFGRETSDTFTLEITEAAASDYAVGGNDPELVVDFAAGTEYYRKSGTDSDFTGVLSFARASDATRVNSSGNIETVSSGTARTGHHIYNGSSWVKAGLLLETEERINYQAESNDFSGYTLDNGTHTANATTSPDGTTNASRYAPTTANSVHRIRATYTTPAAARTVTASAFVKADGYSQIGIREQAISGAGAVFDISAGTVTGVFDATTTVTARIENFGNGWYRISATFVRTSDGAQGMALVLLDGTWTSGNLNLNQFAGNTSLGFFHYGWQLEAGATPSSYIPTSGSTATRVAETLTIPAANTTPSTTAISMQMDGLMTYADLGAAAQETFLRWYADANNYIVVDLDTDSTATGEVNAEQAASGTVDGVAFGTNYSPGVNVAFNIASRHTSGAINVAKDGTAGTADTTPTALANLDGTDIQLGHDFMGTIGQFRLWEDVDLGDAGIATAST